MNFVNEKYTPTCLVFQSVANMPDRNKIIEKENNLSVFEDICLRFPYIGENILRHLDDKSLSNLKLSCKSICAFIQYQRWFWITDKRTDVWSRPSRIYTQIPLRF